MFVSKSHVMGYHIFCFHSGLIIKKRFFMRWEFTAFFDAYQAIFFKG